MIESFLAQMWGWLTSLVLSIGQPLLFVLCAILGVVLLFIISHMEDLLAVGGFIAILLILIPLVPPF